MKNLNGYLKKTLYLFSFLFLLLFPYKVSAQENFKVYTNFKHTVENQSDNVEVILQINSDSTKVISFYTASIPLKNLDVRCKLVKNYSDVNCTKYYRGSVTDVLIDLQNSVVSKDSPVEILLTYVIPIEESDTYKLPSKILDTVTNSVIIKYNHDKGEPLWTSDPTSNIHLHNDLYELSISNPKNSDIVIVFGKNIIYKFSVNRVFSNQGNTEPQTFELVMPPDNQYQTILWEEISPLPNSSVLDEDGNYTFKYIVQAGETMDCKITGHILKQKSELQNEFNPFLTKETGYWNITDTAERKRVMSYLLDKGLTFLNENTDFETMTNEQKEIFYKNLYTYVINRLNYSKDLKLGILNSPRLGANSIIKTPNNANAQDYADFYIALLRKFQIPSRLVIGYVSNISGYSSDGFYHYWVEYFDTAKSMWIQVDPFLEEYTGHSLFNTDFHDHITIVTRGRSPLSPTITFYSPTDFILTADTNSTIEKNIMIESQISFNEYDIAEKYAIGYIYSTNKGNIAITGTTLTKSNISNISKYIDPVTASSSQILLPKQSRTIQLNVPSKELEYSDIYITLNHQNPSGILKIEDIKTSISLRTPISIKILSKITSIGIFSLLILLVYLSFNKIIKPKIWKQH